jgi:chemotaxis protein methyltransferase CheR/type IV pilus assembly protein PilK
MAWSYQAPPELTDEQYARWQTLLEERTGICFLQHKSILQKGLCQRMREINCDDYDQYFSRVSKLPEGIIEWTLLVDRVSVKETSFFRDQHSVKAVKCFLLQRLGNKRSNGQQDYTLDIWSVGCSTGEEAYSLAMIASDVIDYLSVNIFLGVLATDISKTALTQAKKGRYASRKLAGMPVEIRDKYFKKSSISSDDIIAELKQKVCFVQGNIAELESAPKMAMDLIYCQNVLVYFRRSRHKQILDAMVKRLKPGGLLMLGPGEVTGWQHRQMRRSKDETVQAYVKHSPVDVRQPAQMLS